MEYTYPLQLRFRFFALAPRITITDSTNEEIFYIEQKLFKLRETINVFDNADDKNLLYTIQASQLLDFGATYVFKNNRGTKVLGSVQQHGLRSLFRATYTIYDRREQNVFTVTHRRPWVAFFDAFFSSMPLVGLLTGYLFRPTYMVTLPKGKDVVMVMKKKPSFIGTTFQIDPLERNLSLDHENLILLGLLLIVQLEKNRG